MTWDRVLTFLRGRFELERDGTKFCAIRWNVTDADGDATPQQVVVCRSERQGRSWVHIVCDVAPDALTSPREALALGATLVAGAVVLTGGRYCVRYQIGLDGLTGDVLESAMEAVAHEAVELRGKLTARPHTDMFSHYVN